MYVFILSCHPYGAKFDRLFCYNHDVPSGLKEVGKTRFHNHVKKLLNISMSKNYKYRVGEG